MSGGVDSSVAAGLLLREGYDVVGCFMRLGSPEEDPEAGPVLDDGETCDPRAPRKRGCCSVNDAHDARRVAARFGIPLYVCNFRRDFERVMNYFVDEYNAGRTPNPCVRCNDWLKFGRLHDDAERLGASFVASGHYAQIGADSNGSPRLMRGVDFDKDQSYVLFGARPDRLASMLLPIGGLRKSAVRDLAREFDLPVADKPDSQEICFVPDNDYAGFVSSRTPEAFAEGDLLDERGQRIGRHAGHQRFTIGQRRGIGIALGHPIYVVDKDPAANTVTVGERSSLATVACRAGAVTWHAEASSGWIPCHAQYRAHGTPEPARVRADGEELEVEFDAPVDAVAPGQAVVCYDGETIICGGWITETRRPSAPGS